MSLRFLSSASFLPARLMGLALLCGGIAQAAVVVEIDITDPSAVIIRATAGLSSATVSSTAAGGVAFEGFFSSPATVNDVDGEVSRYFSAFDTPGGVGLLSLVAGSLDLSPSPGVDLLLGGSPSGQDEAMNFTSGTTAFFGERIFDLSGASPALPSAGTTGDIYARAASTGVFPSGAFDTVVGQYSVIPEPSTFALLMLAAVCGLGSLRRRR